MQSDGIWNAEPPRPDIGALLDALPGCCALLLADEPVYTIVAANKAYAASVLKFPEEIAGRGMFELVPENPALRASLREVAVTKSAQTMPVKRVEIRRTDDSQGGFEERYWSTVNSPLADCDGEVRFIVHRVEDVTDMARLKWLEETERVRRERDEAEKKLLAMEARFSLAFAQAPIGMLLISPEGKIVEANQAFVDMLGYTRDDLLARDSSFFTHPDDIGSTREFFASLRKGPHNTGSIEKRYFRKSGELLWARASATMRRNEMGRPAQVIAMVEDITARKRAELRYRFLAESIPQMVWTATPDGQLDYVNGQGCAYFGVSAAELLGGGWLNFVHPEDRENTIRRWKESIESGAPYEISFRLKHHSDESWRWHLARALPMTAENGKVTQWFGTCTDIMNQRETEEALRRTNRELEEFAYVASHDLQEPLRMVNIYTQLILSNLAGPNAKIGEYSQFVHQGVHRMQALIHDLLTFSRTVHSEEAAGTADLSMALGEAISVLGNGIHEAGARIVASPLPLVRGDTSQIAHVFQNVLSNALKYRKTDTPPLVSIQAGREGGIWVISIQDNGIGFDPAYADRIFGLFKRLHKDEYPGTGLGLAICKRIVERYGGNMWAEGRPGEGSTFYFSLAGADD